ncbi:MAG: tagatose-bisphosphate aldolase [Elusimicrobia bacterium ADurb.Bin231]|nr:MAG: tagatose-bisphosphate aldolase [Elusimicrobia bacterium ADurb.Bin231]
MGKYDDIDLLVWDAVFGDDETKQYCRYLIRKKAQEKGIGPASVYELYKAIGQGKIAGFTVPAMNMRGMTYDLARAAFRAAKKTKAAAIIFEIARSEMGYTDQQPSEFVASVLGAALKEGYSYPVFIQGDHFQVKEKGYKADPEKELAGVKKLIKDSIEAGFYQIDLDTSTLVDITKATVPEQQKGNCEVAAILTKYIRSLEPAGITVALGGEIGEIGGKNSTEEELRAYVSGYNALLGSGIKGISKIAVQTGTTHGGIPLPDGSIAKVKLDFETLEKLSKISRQEYGLAGCVQHGASTLPSELFDKFPKTGTAEIHLATEFQNMIFDHPKFPSELKNKIYDYLKTNAASERKEGETDTQFFYKTRKKAWGQFKKDTWSIDKSVKDEIMSVLEKKFVFLFEKLNVLNTDKTVAGFVKTVNVEIKKPAISGQEEKFEGAD